MSKIRDKIKNAMTKVENIVSDVETDVKSVVAAIDTDMKYVNSSMLKFPTDIHNLTSDLKKTMLRLASRIQGAEDKYNVYKATMEVLAKHVDARFIEAVAATRTRVEAAEAKAKAEADAVRNVLSNTIKAAEADVKAAAAKLENLVSGTKPVVIPVPTITDTPIVPVTPSAV